jgi:hypothetical protein
MSGPYKRFGRYVPIRYRAIGRKYIFDSRFVADEPDFVFR